MRLFLGMSRTLLFSQPTHLTLQHFSDFIWGGLHFKTLAPLEPSPLLSDHLGQQKRGSEAEGTAGKVAELSSWN